MTAFFRKYVDFRGRADVDEYLRWTVLPLLVILPVAEILFIFLGFEFIDGFKFSNLKRYGVDVIFWLCAIPALAATARRLHDRNLKARYLFALPAIAFAALIFYGGPVVAFWAPIVLLGFGIYILAQCVLPGKEEANRFGPAPKARVAEK